MADIQVANTDADLSGNTIVTEENAYTITGLHTFSRSTNAPFAVVSGAAVVANLNADKLDGQTGTYYLAAANITGTTLASNVVTSSLTTIGTIATGVWQGTDVGVAYGGTGVSTLASGRILIGAGASAIVTTGNADVNGHFNILAENDLRLQDSAGGQYVGFDAPATVSSSYTLTMPAGIGAVDQVLSINNTDGTLQWATPAGGASLQIFTSSGTWTKPAGGIAVYVLLIGGGGGGGGGRRGINGSNKCGGAGGGAAGISFNTYPASVLASSETVTVGAAGAAGSSATSDDTDGGDGGAGGDTSFGTFLIARGGGLGAKGIQGNETIGGAGGVGNQSVGAKGGNSAPGTADANPVIGSEGRMGPGSGGAGGGMDIAPTANPGSNGQDVGSTTALGRSLSGGALGGSAGTAGGNGVSVGTNEPFGGSGGGGGRGNTGGTGGAGGTGGSYGGGAGGGGATSNGAGNSGAGGVGGAGLVLVITT